MSTPLVSLLCHRGPVTAIAFDVEGRHMVTGGIDGQVSGASDCRVNNFSLSNSLPFSDTRLGAF